MTDITERLRLRNDPSQMLMCYPPRPAPDMLCYEAAAEIERLRAALKRIAQHDMQAIAMDALRPDERIRPAKEASDDAAT
jgi:hypothetical protein